LSKALPPPPTPGDFLADAPLVDAMMHLLDGKAGQQMTLGELVAGMGLRGLGFSLIVFGLLAAISLPGIGSLMAVPLILFAIQITAGFQQPWMPRWLSGRSFSADTVKRNIERGRPWLKKIEIFARPRVSWLARGLMERLVGVVCLILALVILMPGPFTNNPPGIAITILGFALAERDGILVVLGLVAAVIAFFVGLSAFIAVAIAIWLWLGNQF
jgi:hypothetical protein